MQRESCPNCGCLVWLKEQTDWQGNGGRHYRAKCKSCGWGMKRHCRATTIERKDRGGAKLVFEGRKPNEH